MVDKKDPFGYNIPCQQRMSAADEPNNGDLHSGSAVDSDSTCGSSILSSPTRKPQSQLAAVFSGHSAVGSAPRSGRGGRGFKSRCSDQKRPVHICVLVFLFGSEQRDLKVNGDAQRRNKSPSGAFVSSRVPTARNVYRGDYRSAVGFEQGGSAAGRVSNQPSGLLLSPRVTTVRNVKKGCRMLTHLCTGLFVWVGAVGFEGARAAPQFDFSSEGMLY